MCKLGIIAYGSLIKDPGYKIENAILGFLMIETPFKVEFARKSNKRRCAPTLVPVVDGGSPVNAHLLILKPDVSEEHAFDMLYRRETDQVDSTNKYPKNNCESDGKNKVCIKKLDNPLAGVETVIYTSLIPNIEELYNPDLSDEEKANHLAELAINSVDSETYSRGRDGIQYLDEAITAGIITPLTQLYKEAILRLVNSTALSEARDITAKRRKIIKQTT